MNSGEKGPQRYLRQSHSPNPVRYPKQDMTKKDNPHSPNSVHYLKQDVTEKDNKQ